MRAINLFMNISSAFLSLSAGVLLLCSASVSAQHTFTNGNHSLQLSGAVSAYYNYRFLKEGELDRKNNRFRLRDMQLGLNGRVGKQWAYKIRVDMADLAESAMQGVQAIDPENPGLMSAYVEYTGLPVDIKVGYDKLPYSQGSMLSFEESVFWQRGQLIRGDFFSRRDIGVTLTHSMWKQRINLYAGVYTGLGENIIGNNDNDPSGRLEYIGRADVAYPARYRYVESDILNVPIPMVRAGVNARYTNKSQPSGEQLPDNVGGAYGLRVIDGKRLAYGWDASFQYLGFSAQFEAQVLRLEPASAASTLFYNNDAAVHKGIVKAGGWQAQINYCVLPAKSVVSVRYENYNLNDLVAGETHRLGIGYAYLINGYRAVLKLHYYRIVSEDVKLEPLKWTDQLRIGMSYAF